MRKRYLLITGFLVAAFVSNAQTTQLTLKDCIDTALKNNIGVQQSEVLKSSAEVNYKQAKNNRLPLVNSFYNYSINNGRTIDPFTNGYINQQLKSSDMSVQASLPVFSGFQLKNTIKQNEMAFAGATMEWQQRKDELTLQVILAYLQVLNNQDAIALARQQADVTKQQVDRLNIVGQEGATPPGNVSDLKGQYAGDQITLVNAENDYATSLLTLTQLMNVPYNDKLQLDRAGVTEDIQQFVTMPDEIYSMALQKLASVKAADFRVNSAAAAVKVAAAARYPTVSLFGGASTNYSSAAMLNNMTGTTDVPTGDYVVYNGANLPVITKRADFESTPITYGSQFKNNISRGFGVSVRIPIFNAFRVNSAVKLARNDEKNFKLIADNIKLQLRQGIEQAFININGVYKRYQALQQQVDAYTESFRISALRFENGVINSPEFLIAKNNMDRAKANLIIAKYEYLLRKKILDFYMGQLN
ncbi:MAG: TolC family protein [Ferruginibacter sp.]